MDCFADARNDGCENIEPESFYRFRLFFIEIVALIFDSAILVVMFEKIISSNLKTFLIFLFFGFICYGWILNSPFKTMDDYTSVVHNPLLHEWSSLPEIFQRSFFGGSKYYRPLVETSFLVEYQFFGLNHIFYNLNNVLLHILTGFSVFLFLNQLLSSSGLTRGSSLDSRLRGNDNGKVSVLSWNRRVIAFWVAFLFLIHPIHWEQVTNIPGRSILLCALFFVLSCYLFLKGDYYREEQSDAAIQGFGLLRFIRNDVLSYSLSFFCFILSLLSKESGVLLPVCLVGMIVFLFPRENLKQNLLRVLPFFFLLGIYFLIRHQLGIGTGRGEFSFEEKVLGVITFLKSLWIHFKSLILPLDLYYDRSLPVFESFLNWRILLISGSWLVVAGVLFFFRRKLSQLIWFLIFWMIVHLSIVSQIIPIYESDGRISIADHFLYLPSIAFFVFVVLSFQKLFQYLKRKEIISQKILKIVVSLVFAFLIIVTIQQALYSSNQIALFEQALKYNPGNMRIRNALAVLYAYGEDFEKAEMHYREMLRQQPDNAKARINLGKVLCDTNRCDQALVEYEKVRNPSEFIGILLENMKQTLKILIQDHEKKDGLESELNLLYFKYAQICDSMQDAKTAVIYYQKFIHNETSKSAAVDFAKQRVQEIKMNQ